MQFESLQFQNNTPFSNFRYTRNIVIKLGQVFIHYLFVDISKDRFCHVSDHLNLRYLESI